jgi:hypothetical protein
VSPRLRISMVPHARDQMRERNISEDQLRQTLERPETEYSGDFGRTVAERRFGGRNVIKVVYNRGLQDERIVVTVMRARSRR